MRLHEKLLPHSSQHGFVTLIFVLVMASVMLTVGVAVSLRSIENLQSSSWYDAAAAARQLAMACAEEGLRTLRQSWADASRALSLTNGSCTMEVTTAPGSATVTGVGTAGAAHRRVRVTVDPSLMITEWLE